MEIALRIIGGLIITFTCSIMLDWLIPKFKRKEQVDEATAGKNKTVKLSKELTELFAVSIPLLNIVAIIIVAAPVLITEYMGMNYIVVLCVWGAMTLFNDIMMFFLFTKATYDEEKIIVKKVFRKAKDYYYSDITYFSPVANLRVKTTKGSFILFNAFAGTASLRAVLFEKCKDARN